MSSRKSIEVCRIVYSFLVKYNILSVRSFESHLIQSSPQNKVHYNKNILQIFHHLFFDCFHPST